jgi:phosphatidylglycerol:prolipoprotein diacylglycerol transferase
MYPVLFKIGPLTIYSFGTLMALAAIAAGWILHVELKRCRYDPDLASTLVVAAGVGGLIGARLFFVFEDWAGFVRSPLDFVLSGAGFTWYGGLMGGAIAVTWMVRRRAMPWLQAADIAAPALALAYGIGRLGCHVAGDGDWGTVTDVPWAVAYTNAIIGWVHPLTGIPYPAGVKVHPTPVYEFIQSTFVFGILWLLRKRSYRDGTIFWLYLILAGLMRFVVEFWRVNSEIALGMSQAQWISLVLMGIGGYMMYAQDRRDRRIAP